MVYNLVETVSVDIEFIMPDIPEPEMYSDTKLYRAAGHDAPALRRAFRDLRDHEGNLRVTEADIVRPAGMGGSQATVKTWADSDDINADALRQAVGSGVETRMVVKVNDEWVFTGIINLIKQNEEGIITFEAVDSRMILNQYTVRLDTSEDGAYSTQIVEELLVNDGPFAPSDVIIDVDDPVTIKDTWGADHRPTLREVLKQIKKADAATVYIDSQDRIHYSDVPPTNYHDNLQGRVTALDAGDSKDTNERVIVEGPGVSNMLDIGWNKPQTGQGSTRAEASSRDHGDGEEPVENATLEQHHNVRSKEQANNAAVSEWMGSNLVKDSGTIELAGVPHVTPWDTILLEDIHDLAPLSEGTYGVQEVKHIINTDDGYKTELKLTEDLKSLFDRVTDTEGAMTEKKEKLEEEEDDETEESRDWEEFDLTNPAL